MGYEEIARIIDEEFKCLHADTVLRFKVLSDGRRAYLFQCRRCGWKSGHTSLKKIPFPEIPKATPVDEEVARMWWDRRAKRHEEMREAERKSEREDFRREHDEYLRSMKWRQKREEVLKRANYVCEGCRKNRATQVHHLNYDHWQDELLWELVAVCRECHARAHPTGGLSGSME